MTEIVEVTLPEITLHDRCDDACSQHAVAVVQVSESTSYLYFCGHHWRANSSKIKELGYAYSVSPEHDVIFTNRLRSEETLAYAARDAGSA